MGAGATYCCSQDERKNSFKAYINNLRLTGIDCLGDLDSTEPSSEYKNSYEAEFKLTKEGVLMFIDDMMRKFSKVNTGEQNTHAKVNVKVVAAGIGLQRSLPCVMQ